MAGVANLCLCAQGIPTDVQLTGVNLADTKFASLLLLMRGDMQQKLQVRGGAPPAPPHPPRCWTAPARAQISPAGCEDVGVVLPRARAQVTTTNLTVVGQSAPSVCDLCRRRVDSSNMDPGCHPKPARTSYNLQSPFTPSKGVLGSVYALAFTPGPEQYVSGAQLCS